MVAGRAGPPVVLIACWAVMWKVAPFSDVRITDIYVYMHDAALLASGAAPYSHGFPFEYPPVALAVLGAGRWLGGTYETTFGLLMLAMALLAQWGVRALAGARAAWAFAPVPLLAGCVLRTHYDLAAAVVLVAALVAFERARPLGGFALLGVGAMVKGFPVVLVPVAMAWCWGQGRRATALWGAAVFAAVSLAISAPFLGTGYLDAYRFHLDRPVQVESSPAVVLYALGGSRVTGSDTVPDAYSSNGLTGGGAGVVQPLFGVLAAAVIALLSWLASQRAEPRHLTLCCAAAVLAFVALGKVLSPQYVAWLAPLAAVLLARRERVAAGALALAILLTQVEFPVRYRALVRGDDAVRLLVGVRDAVLLVALGLLIARAAAAARSTRRAAAGPRTAPAPP